MRMLIVVAALVVSLPALADSAADLAKIDATYKKCMDTDQSNAGMKQCTWSAGEAADKVLNQTYQRVSKEWGAGDDADAKERKKRLVNAQRAWVTFRDAQCLLDGAAMLGGTGEGLAQGICLYDQTRVRVKQIEDVLEH